MNRSPEICLIVAMTHDGVIGHAGTIPWHIPEDLRHVKELTVGHAILMGRATFASIGRPLPDRHNVVVTSHPEALPPKVIVAASVAEGLQRASQAQPHPERIFLFGGQRIYAEGLELVQTAYVTMVHQPFAGDTFFPARWEELPFDVSERSDHVSRSGVRFSWLRLRRRSLASATTPDGHEVAHNTADPQQSIPYNRSD